MSKQVAVMMWHDTPNGSEKTIAQSLTELEHQVSYFKFDAPIPDTADVVFSYAPSGPLHQITAQLEKRPTAKRPAWVHWMTEAPPNLSLPQPLLYPLTSARAWLDRLNYGSSSASKRVSQTPPYRFLNRKAANVRDMGELRYAQKAGALTLLTNISKVYADWFTARGLPSTFAPWWLLNEAEANEKTETQDIDVLWIGARPSRRLKKIRAELQASGVKMHVVNGIENPLMTNPAHSQLISRAKISLNLLPTRSDNSMAFRFPLVAANNSLMLSEEGLNHNPHIKNFVHYVGLPTEQIVPTILDYLKNQNSRAEITQDAYQLVTQEQTMTTSVAQMMDALERTR